MTVISEETPPPINKGIARRDFLRLALGFGVTAVLGAAVGLGELLTDHNNSTTNAPATPMTVRSDEAVLRYALAGRGANNKRNPPALFDDELISPSAAIATPRPTRGATPQAPSPTATLKPTAKPTLKPTPTPTVTPTETRVPPTTYTYTIGDLSEPIAVKPNFSSWGNRIDATAVMNNYQLTLGTNSIGLPNLSIAGLGTNGKPCNRVYGFGPEPYTRWYNGKNFTVANPPIDQLAYLIDGHPSVVLLLSNNGYDNSKSAAGNVCGALTTVYGFYVID